MEHAAVEGLVLLVVLHAACMFLPFLPITSRRERERERERKKKNRNMSFLEWGLRIQQHVQTSTQTIPGYAWIICCTVARTPVRIDLVTTVSLLSHWKNSAFQEALQVNKRNGSCYQLPGTDSPNIYTSTVPKKSHKQEPRH